MISSRRPDDRSKNPRAHLRGERRARHPGRAPRVAIRRVVTVDVQYGRDAAVLLTLGTVPPEPLDAHAATSLFALGLQIGRTPRRGHRVTFGGVEVAGDVRFLVGHTNIGRTLGLRSVGAGIEHVLRTYIGDTQRNW